MRRGLDAIICARSLAITAVQDPVDGEPVERILKSAWLNLYQRWLTSNTRTVQRRRVSQKGRIQDGQEQTERIHHSARRGDGSGKDIGSVTDC